MLTVNDRNNILIFFMYMVKKCVDLRYLVEFYFT